MKFTIAIPAYKRPYLKDCIDSILNQTLADFELVIVNDASPEDLDSVVAAYHDPRIRYYTNETNFGSVKVVDNWNKCLGLALGEYFVLMGDDDKMAAHYLQTFAALIEKHPAHDVYHCRSQIINEQSETTGFTPLCCETESVYERLYQRLKSSRTQFVSDFVYRTSTLKQKGGFYTLPLAWGSDDITSYIMCGSKGIVYTGEPLLQYRISASTITQSGDPVQKINAIRQAHEWYRSFLRQPAAGQKDEFRRSGLLADLPAITKKHLRSTIALSMPRYNLFFWLKQVNSHKIGYCVLAMAVAKYLKDNLKQVRA